MNKAAISIVIVAVVVVVVVIIIITIVTFLCLFVSAILDYRLYYHGLSLFT